MYAHHTHTYCIRTVCKWGKHNKHQTTIARKYLSISLTVCKQAFEEKLEQIEGISLHNTFMVSAWNCCSIYNALPFATHKHTQCVTHSTVKTSLIKILHSPCVRSVFFIACFVLFIAAISDVMAHTKNAISPHFCILRSSFWHISRKIASVYFWIQSTQIQNLFSYSPNSVHGRIFYWKLH